MKKIICTVTTDLNYDQRMQRICTSLQNNGFEVELVGRELSSSTELTTQNYKQTRLKCHFNKGKLFYIEYNIRLYFYLLFTSFDIIYAVDLDTISAAFSVGILKWKRRIYDAHEFFTELPEIQHRKFTKAIWSMIASVFIPFAHLKYTVGDSLAEVLSKKYSTTFHTIRNVPFRKESVSIINKEPKIILYQGALNVGRGLECAIKSMQFVENAELHLAGDGDIKKDLERLVKSLKLTEKVTFLGKLKPKELSEVTQKSWLGLNLLEHLGLNYYYSLANKFFDYIQAGIPSINPNFPEYKSLVKEYDCALILEKLDKKELAQKMNHLLENEKNYKYLCDNAKKAAEALTWEKEEKKLLSIFQNVN